MLINQDCKFVHLGSAHRKAPMHITDTLRLIKTNEKQKVKISFDMLRQPVVFVWVKIFSESCHLPVCNWFFTFINFSRYMRVDAKFRGIP